MADISREEFTSWKGVLQTDLRAIHDRLDTLNDRTRIAEQSVAVLNDRAGPARAAMWGSGGAGLVISLVEGLKWWLHK